MPKPPPCLSMRHLLCLPRGSIWRRLLVRLRTRLLSQCVLTPPLFDRVAHWRICRQTEIRYRNKLCAARPTGGTHTVPSSPIKTRVTADSLDLLVNANVPPCRIRRSGALQICTCHALARRNTRPWFTRVPLKSPLPCYMLCHDREISIARSVCLVIDAAPPRLNREGHQLHFGVRVL